ncbi:MAG: response regulator transcription factor [Pirellulaceae bacterium]
MNNGETVFIVDGDNESRKRVCGLVQTMKLRHEAYALAQDFLDQYDPQRPGCAILEVRIPDVGGLQLQQQLAKHTPAVPVIFLAAHVSVPVVVRAIQQGAVNFLQKPAEEQELWDTIQQALQIDRERRAAVAEVVNLQSLVAVLTHKEYEVLELLAQEKSTRAIARELQVSVRTVEFRRARMMNKLHIKSPMQLFHFALRALDHHRGNGNGSGQGNGKHRPGKVEAHVDQ